jgi:DNA topoisomerase-1
MNVLIIAEKPSVARKIAAALGEPKQESIDGEVSYFEVKKGNDTIYVAAAVGHLFTIKQSSKGREIPVLDVEWAPSYEVNKISAHTKPYLNTIASLSKKCDKFINACDFDLEGTVIGTNIIKFVNSGKIAQNSARMKFSTTTEEDLRYAYEHQMPLDINNYYAGEARHMLDWLWGINLSRALTSAVYGKKFVKMLSIGRVQGPTLAVLAKREIEISKFIPKPFWRLIALVGDTEFGSKRGDIFEKELARKAFEEASAHKSSGRIDDVETKEQEVQPYPPFDLTSLQLEASRALHIDPSMTLSLAQSLYEKSYISYPRTSSQKLPSALGLPKIIDALSKNPQYRDLAESLVKNKRFIPLEGAKEDEAHPAIYPTGVVPERLGAHESKLYDMIARRFMACFAERAKVERGKITVSFGSELFIARGSRIMSKGWLSYYTYAKIDEVMLPRLNKGANAAATSIKLDEMETQPPKRYGKAGLIAELEKKNLGTKATRASIIDTLFKRNYIEGTSIKVTKFGMSVYETLRKNAEMITDEETTERLEEDTDKISKGKLSESDVIDEGKKMLLDALALFEKNKTQISESMRAALKESEPVLGKCPKDGGDLVIKRSRFGKNFVACKNYPNCTQTYSLPQQALIEATGKTCEICHTPIIKVIRRGRRPFTMDLDPNCVTKKDWKKKEPETETIPQKGLQEIKRAKVVQHGGSIAKKSKEEDKEIREEGKAAGKTESKEEGKTEGRTEGKKEGKKRKTAGKERKQMKQKPLKPAKKKKTETGGGKEAIEGEAV